MNAFAVLCSGATRPQVTVAEAMHWGLVSCSSEDSLRAVAALMSDNRVHCVVVIDDPSDKHSMWGVVSDHDLVAAATVRSLDEQQAGGSAMKPVVTVAPGELLADAAKRMTRLGLSHLVVVDPVEHRPLGVLSTLDLAAMLAAAWSPLLGTNPYFPAPDSRR
ncbi:MAG: CBS domain-containing protein [Gaiellaceae bacterium]